MLPSGYKNINVCYVDGYEYIDTGVAPTNNTEIEIAFMINCTETGTTRRFIFGARDGTSNTSVGINLAKTYNNGYYLSYGNTNTLISTTKGNFSPITSGSESYDFTNLSILKLSNGIATLTETPSYNALDETSVSAFSGVQTMYLFGLNNNGSVTYATRGSAIAYCKIWNNGVLIKDYIACLNESTDYVGLYEQVAEEFFPTISITSSYGTSFYGSHYNVEPTVSGEGVVTGTLGKVKCGVLIATPKEGYLFNRWEFNGSTISNENPLAYDTNLLRRKYGIDSGGTFNPVAVFTKKIKEVASLGFKMAVYSGLPEDYLYKQKGVFSIRSASISVDGKQKTSNSFKMDGSFNVALGDYVYVYSQLGKNIFNGVVESYNENEIVCGEMKAVYDKDGLFHNNSTKTISYNGGFGEQTVRVTDASISYALPEIYLPMVDEIWDQEWTESRLSTYTPYIRFMPFFSNTRLVPVSYSVFANEYYGEPARTNFPLVESTEVKNLHTFVCDLFSELGIYVENRTIPRKTMLNGKLESYLDIIVFPRMASTDVLKIGENSENIQNINIQEETSTTTYLIIFNSSGTTLRGAYTIDSDGAIVKEDGHIGTVPVYVPKIVLSDDNLNTVIQSSLSAGQYNHMITFDVLLGGEHNLKLDDFNINQRVDFYYKNKMYRSIVTAYSYEIAENDDTIQSVKVTLGLARNNLTSKLNLRKVGKK